MCPIQCASRHPLANGVSPLIAKPYSAPRRAVWELHEVSAKNYRRLRYGYAATIHKAQGTTVDAAWMLAHHGEQTVAGYG